MKSIVKKGDKLSANKLIELYYKDVYRYVYKQNQCKETSKDLTQDIFISMLRSIHSYDERKSSFKTWIYKVASNKIIDFYRSKYYKYKTIVDEIEEYKLYSDIDIEKSFLLKEDANEIMEILNTMESGIQEIFRLKVFADISFREIAVLTNLSESTVKTRYYATIKKIKVIIERRANGER
ncbi:MAG: RNA polymerase sigma factor [Sarcina sp.]